MLIEQFRKFDDNKLKYRVRTLIKRRIKEFDLSKYEFAVLFAIEPEKINDVLIYGFEDKTVNLTMNFILSNSNRFIQFVNSRIKYEI